MHEKPVKLDMSFDEALLRIARTPKSSAKDDTEHDKNLEKIKLKAGVELQTKTAPSKRRTRHKSI